MTPGGRKALDEYVNSARAHYGARLADPLIFGSRTRGDARRDSEADVPVVLNR